MPHSAAKSNVKFNYSDYLLLPEDKRYELIEGDLYMTPATLTIHQIISVNLCCLLKDHVQKNQLGLILTAPTDVVLSDEDVVQPDILFISNERKGILKRENVRGAPDLVVEILSPSTAERDLHTKKKLYSRHAVLEYWIVNPEEKTIEIMEWTEQGFKILQVYPAQSTLSSKIFPGFRLNVSDIFKN